MRVRMNARFWLVGVVLAVGACAHNAPPHTPKVVPVAHSACVTAGVSLRFDFEGASQSRCIIDGERAFSVLISPEHAPPINPSPWYAFRYSADPGRAVTVTLRYLEARHRYPPKLETDGKWTSLDVHVKDGGRSASFSIPAGQGRIAAQEIFDPARHHALLKRLARSSNVARLTLGLSHDQRPIEALRVGDPSAARLVVLLGRAHPPEVTGALAMEVFLTRIIAAAEAGQLEGVQVLAVPLLNPDGVARGHWRSNLGGGDLNRDWGDFTQPETRSVSTWLARLPSSVRPVAMVDFHSTDRNLFYVQGPDETDEEQERFLVRWLGGQEQAIPGYPFTVERRSATNASKTSKYWFHRTFGIPAYTYEVGDETERDGIERSAIIFADRFVSALQTRQ
ncbi:MAG: hypothetical protein B7Y98_03460 [Sphingomonas sp. 32-62-10]|nr:MAG: hypothetical protein B7Z43_07075 [Sphingomonas sp. 12-62-6]OYX39889.1 MAG: hypothetical protein B7Y98_03460 [Sphingomonas sp. 32-62-10]OYY63215.1 MAG: hypothetical protein B7Y49_13675 [Sphingomonas sp. 28-62-11]